MSASAWRGSSKRSAGSPPVMRSVPARLAATVLALGLLVVAAEVISVLRPASSIGVLTRLGLRSACHQIEDRCLTIGGVTMPACARCAGLHASALAGSLLALALLAARREPTQRKARAAVLVTAAMLGLDVVAGMTLASWDHPVLRAITGAAFGIACLIFLTAREQGNECNAPA